MRAARAAGFALLAVVLAVGAHGLGGGRLPSAGTVLALWLAVLPVAGLLARRTWGPGPLVAALGVLELGLHHALGLGTAVGAAAPEGTSAAAATHRAAASAVAGAAHGSHGAAQHGDALASAAHTVGSGAVPAYASAGHDHHTGTLMLLGHVVATVLTAVLLARGDALLARLWAWATLRDLPRTDVRPLALRATPPAACRLRTVAGPLVAAGGVCRRGPPAA